MCNKTQSGTEEKKNARVKSMFVLSEEITHKQVQEKKDRKDVAVNH